LLQGNRNCVLIVYLFYCPPSPNGSGATGFAFLQIKKRSLAKGPLSTELNNYDIGGVIPKSETLKEVLSHAGQGSMLQEPFTTLCSDKNKGI